MNHRSNHRRNVHFAGRAIISTGALLACFSPGVTQAMAVGAPLVLVRSMTIPHVPIGPFSDHLAVDAAGGRVFATPQAAHEVAVFDFRDGRLLKLIPGIANPHGIFYSSEVKRLFVVDGASGDLKVFSGENYSPLKTIDLTLGADWLVYDPRTKLLYVNNSGSDARMPHSLVSVVNVITMEKIADIPIAAPSLEGSAVDSGNQLLYVALDTRGAVAVVDLRTRRTVATWQLPKGHRDMALAVDPANARLYIACRDSAMHGSLIVLNTANGRLVASLPIGGWTDGIGFDRKRHRIYVPTGVGHIDTYAIEPNDTYRRLPTVDTAILGKTACYSNRVDRMFVDVPELFPEEHEEARVMEFKPGP